ncbi:FtsK/SpoIIIE domain-containing protein [Mobilicoccus caccae]|uniref:FtsK domain-containing protein n=1 Tax=Mobilicoccus caccae TaxID=1859295 RepID=A0ABQ6IVK2_9MICO|nr:FtsK/SpoIIIE domain-containing protein [Mobilicoccus caccae]GMA41481.1 hypothetical protein GCM10025883_35260 [Mobilicoccus caccae]
MVVPFGLEDRPAEQRRAVATLRLNDGVPLAIIGAARSGRTGALSAVAASVARRFAPTEVQVYAIDAGARALGDLEESPNVGAVVFRDELDRLGRLVMRLAEELDRRIQTLALHRRRDIAAQREAEPDAPWPYMAVLIDRWDLLTEEAEVSDDRTLVSTLERLVTEGGRAGILVVATGDRSMLTGRATALFPDRLVLRLADAYDYVSAGLSGPPGRGEPGRGWRAPEGVETQVAEAGVDAVGDAEGETGVPDRVVPWSRGGPFRIDRLPVLVTRDDVTELVEAMALERAETRSADVPVVLGEPVEGRSGSAGALLVAVGGDELGPRSIDVDEHGPCALVTGRRRTGRSGVLVAMVESALEGGWEVAVVTARRSPLTRLPAVYPRVHGPFRHDEDAPELAEVVRRALREGRRLLVVADDVDLLPEGALADELASLPQRMRDTGSFFVGSGEAEEILASFRGPAPALRRARCGVMLAPQGTEEGDAFGVRLRRGQYGRALGVGAGYLVLDGLAERVQVVRSDLLPAPGL